MSWTLVTGAPLGLGRAIALTLAQKKHNLVLHYCTHQKEAQALADMCHEKGVLAEIIQGDFEKGVPDFIDRYLSRFKDTKHLINNVGNYKIGSLEATSIEEWNALFQVNFFAPIQLMKALGPSIIAHAGTITNIGVAGLSSKVDLKCPAYRMTKSALLSYTKTLAKELASKKVRVNMLSPGYMENAVDLEQAELPFKRPASLKEVADWIAFLIDPKNEYITGQNIEVAGGIGL